MLNIISGAAVFSGGGVGLWYFTPTNGKAHPLTKKPLLDSLIPIAIVTRARHRHGDGHRRLRESLIRRKRRPSAHSQPLSPSAPATKNAQSGLIRVKKATAAVTPVIRAA